jgi:hypothetical protein
VPIILYDLLAYLSTDLLLVYLLAVLYGETHCLVARSNTNT